MRSTNKHTKKRLNPGFVLLVANLILLASLLSALVSLAGLQGRLEESCRKVEQLTVELKSANKAEQEATQALQDFKTEYYISQASLENTVTEVPAKTITVRATAYCSCTKCCGTWSKDHPSRQGTDYEQHTTLGTVPVAGRTVAVDPEVIPLGSRIVLDGHEYTAEDTGSGVKGNHIDIYFDSHEEALEWGVKTLEVQVFEDEIL